MKLITKDGHEITRIAEMLPSSSYVNEITVDLDGRITDIDCQDSDPRFDQIELEAADGQRWFVHPVTDCTILEKDLLLVPDEWNEGDPVPPDAKAPVVDTSRYDKIVAECRDEWASFDEIDIDALPVISEGDDNGCYVQAWAWVSFDGVEGLDKEAEEEDID
jgi:hypothetical protein